MNRLMIIAVATLCCLSACGEYGENTAAFYERGDAPPATIPVYEESRVLLPEPVFPSRPDYIDFYYRAWELGFDHYKAPLPGSPLVASYIDEAFNENIFLWDMSFSTMWGNYAHHVFPSIEGLDNFYVLQQPDGEIAREIGESDGVLGVMGWSELGTPGNLNHPMLAWAELEAYRFTSDTERLARVYPALRAYRESFQKILDPDTKLYLGDKALMDDSPRNDRLKAGIDVSAEMVLFDRWLATIADILNEPAQAGYYRARAADYGSYLNGVLWDEETGFYYDWGIDGQRMTMRTIAGFWPMLARMSSPEQVNRLVAHLNDTESFNTVHRVPTHPMNEVGYDADYWAGAVWAPTNTMVIEGLINYGRHDLAREIAISHLDGATEVFLNTGTAWENYYPEALLQGREAKPDFVGWSGLAPIKYLIEYVIGIRVDGPSNRIEWRMNESSQHGINNLRYRTLDGKENIVSLVASAQSGDEHTRDISVECEVPFQLVIYQGATEISHDIQCDQSVYRLK